MPRQGKNGWAKASKCATERQCAGRLVMPLSCGKRAKFVGDGKANCGTMQLDTMALAPGPGHGTKLGSKSWIDKVKGGYRHMLCTWAAVEHCPKSWQELARF